jgi:hypothetical protein
MSQVSILNGSRLFAAATAISAVGFLTVPAPARADAACGQYQFTGDFGLTQSNGWYVGFGARGTNVNGSARASHPGKPLGDAGFVSGGIQGRHVDFTIAWTLAENNGAKGHYWGDVDDNGLAHGQNVDEANPGHGASWDSTTPLGCVASSAAPPPPAAPPERPIAPIGKTHGATVTNDVDLYDVKNVPDGAGKVIGMLPAGAVVTLLGSCNPQDWCNVKTDQAGTGWVWGNLQL